MELIFNLFSFDITVIYRVANCKKKVHCVVLIYIYFSRQRPFSVFDDALNLTVYNSNIVAW